MSREILVALDFDSPVALRRQLERALRDAVRSGRLRPGAPLPSTRGLAADLGVSRGLVVAAYDQLTAEGYFRATRGSGTTVAMIAAAHSRLPARAVPATPAPYDFRPGTPDTSLLPRSRWWHHMHAAYASLGDRGWDYGDPAGFPPLRRALAAYLGRVRGVVAPADRIVICSGFAGGLSLLARLLAERGFTSFAVEDPGSFEVHPILRRAGIEPVAIRVDAGGIDPRGVIESRARVALLTPAHQFPTGAVLSAERRADLVAWAREIAGFVIEDDYDAEFRYDRVPIGATQGLAPERVVYAGSLSKTLAPALRLGWLVLPEELVESSVALRRELDLGNPTLPQATFALMLESGDYDRHLRRARRVYRRRRDLLVQTLERSPLPLILEGAAAGLHMVATLPGSLGEAEVVAAAAQRGVGLYGLSRYRVPHSAGTRQALVLGYGAFTDRGLSNGLRRLGDVLASFARPAPKTRSRSRRVR